MVTIKKIEIVTPETEIDVIVCNRVGVPSHFVDNVTDVCANPACQHPIYHRPDIPRNFKRKLCSVCAFAEMRDEKDVEMATTQRQLDEIESVIRAIEATPDKKKQH